MSFFPQPISNLLEVAEFHPVVIMPSMVLSLKLRSISIAYTIQADPGSVPD